jgi:glycerophosphoryl diester phosphodiesterase
LQYPQVLFLSDTVASVRLTMPQAMRNKKIQKDGFKTPDLLILEAIRQNGVFFGGLFIELKKESPFKANGEIKASQNNHLKLQKESLEKLNQRGYRATFCWSFEQAKKEIDNYLR